MEAKNITSRNLVEKFCKSKSVTDAELLIEHFKSAEISAEDVAYLAEIMAGSGKTIINRTTEEFADVASTGGPSSLSTLLCPLYLQQIGYKVVSLGIPGRPAGGIDVLAQIPNYKIELNSADIEKGIKNYGYVHFLANEDFAPLDAILFKLRQKRQAQDIPALVTASLLSKKVAVGVKVLGLDIRVASHGNFGRTWEQAKLNARFFCEVASLLNIKAKCYLTDAEFVYQPFIGRGESLLALFNLFHNKAERNLSKHSDLCREMAYSLKSGNEEDNYTKKNVFELFKSNLLAQGGDITSFEYKAKEIQDGHSDEFLISDIEGYLKIDLNIIRDVLVNIQRDHLNLENSFPDPSGIILKKTTGDCVEKGDILASLRGNREVLKMLRRELPKSFSTVRQPFKSRKVEIIENV